MSSEVHAGASFGLSTRGLAPSARLSTLRDLFERKVQLRFEADPQQPVDVQTAVHGLPGLGHATMASGIGAALERSRQTLPDREDDVCLILGMGGPVPIEHGRTQSRAQDGEAGVLVCREPATLRFRAMTHVAVRVPGAALAPLTTDVAPAAGRHLRRDTTALQLLESYLKSLPARIADPRLRGLVTAHVHDLIALAIGAPREGAEIAARRGPRAARLQAIQAALAKDPDLTIHEIARDQAVSPRYVQKLFQESGTTFTDYVLGLRLEATRAMLVSPRYAHWTITAISQEAGFGDLSHFNRRFKARYAGTPSEIRAKALGPS